MPRITLRSDRADGKEETVSEYIYDWPDCANVAVHVLGVSRVLRTFAIVCASHAEMLADRSQR